MDVNIRWTIERLKEIARYFENKTPKSINFADADSYEYQIYELFQDWQKTFPDKDFKKEFPTIELLWEELGSWHYQDEWSREKCEKIIVLAEKSLEEIKAYEQSQIETAPITPATPSENYQTLKRIKSELESLSSERPKEFYYAIDGYDDDYYGDSLGALIYQWNTKNPQKFDQISPLTCELRAVLREANDGVERSVEEYEKIIDLAKQALEEVSTKIKLEDGARSKKTEDLKNKLRESLLKEKELTEKITTIIEERLKKSSEITDEEKIKLAELRSDNEDAKKLIFLLESMLQDRSTFESFSRIDELVSSLKIFSYTLEEALTENSYEH